MAGRRRRFDCLRSLYSTSMKALFLAPRAVHSDRAAYGSGLKPTPVSDRAAQARVRRSPRHTPWLSVYCDPRGSMFDRRETELMRCEIASLHPPKVSMRRLPPRELSD